MKEMREKLGAHEDHEDTTTEGKEEVLDLD